MLAHPSGPYRDGRLRPACRTDSLPITGVHHEVGIILAGARTEAGWAELESHQLIQETGWRIAARSPNGR
jgi:hypothetical protein